MAIIDLKERERCCERDRVFSRTKCCWVGTKLLSCVLSLSFLGSCCVQVFGRLPLLRGTPECFRQSLHLSLLCVSACRLQSLSLTGSPVVTPFIYTYIHIHLVSIVLIGSGFCAFACVEGSAVVFALLLFLFGYSSVQHPRGPASFFTHARRNAKTLTTGLFYIC